MKNMWQKEEIAKNIAFGAQNIKSIRVMTVNINKTLFKRSLDRTKNENQDSS